MNAVQSSLPSHQLKSKQVLNKSSSTSNENCGRIPWTFNLYDDPPTMELSLDEFEHYALARLQVLRKIEQLKSFRNTIHGNNNSPQNLNASATISSNQTKFETGIDEIIQETKLNMETMDTISHFILRAAYSLDEEKRRWFLQQESALFHHRCSKLTKGGTSSTKSRSLMKHKFGFQSISKQEKQQYQKEIMVSSGINHPMEYTKDYVYKVPFVQALELIAKRECFVSKGYAYIPYKMATSIMVAKFRTHLSRCLAVTAASGVLTNTHSIHNHSVEQEDLDDHDQQQQESERLFPLLQNMHSCLDQYNTAMSMDGASGDYDCTNQTNITHTTVPKLVRHMPLCMRQLQKGLIKEKKLRYWGRQQYGLFLKGIGLSLDESILFFQKSFSNLTPEQFIKQYAYNIRHSYGQEGKRANYKPYNCSKIIIGNIPAPVHDADFHGCPFKHYDINHLSSMLQYQLQIQDPKDRKEILQLAKSKQYQLACLKHFEIMHPKALQYASSSPTNPSNHYETSTDAATTTLSLRDVGNHPNAWFRASVDYHQIQSSTGEK